MSEALSALVHDAQEAETASVVAESAASDATVEAAEARIDASAAEASGNATVANQYFRKLTEVAVGDERPELVAARKKIAVTERSSTH